MSGRSRSARRDRGAQDRQDGEERKSEEGLYRATAADRDRGARWLANAAEKRPSLRHAPAPHQFPGEILPWPHSPRSLRAQWSTLSLMRPLFLCLANQQTGAAADENTE